MDKYKPVIYCPVIYTSNIPSNILSLVISCYGTVIRKRFYAYLMFDLCILKYIYDKNYIVIDKKRDVILQFIKNNANLGSLQCSASLLSFLDRDPWGFI